MSFDMANTVLGWSAAGANGVAGAWALAAHWNHDLRRRSLWYLTAVAQLLLAAQVVLVVVDIQVNDLEPDGVQLFYGFLSLFFIGIIYSYRHQMVEWQYLLYGFGGLFLMGMALRAIFIPAA